MITHEIFVKSLDDDLPPEEVSPLLLSLWYDAKGNWKKSHAIISKINSKEAALIHAYLHRKEGDIWNADYWYRIAGENRKDISLKEEWVSLVRTLAH